MEVSSPWQASKKHCSQRTNSMVWKVTSVFSAKEYFPFDRQYCLGALWIESTYADLGGVLSTLSDNTLQDPQNSPFTMKAKFNNCYIIHSNKIPSLQIYWFSKYQMSSFCSCQAWCPLCITSRRLSNRTCCFISSELWQDGQSLFCCYHAVFQGVSRWLNNGVHLYIDVSVGQCTQHNLHGTSHIEISIQRTECWRSGACFPWHSGFVTVFCL